MNNQSSNVYTKIKGGSVTISWCGKRFCFIFILVVMGAVINLHFSDSVLPYFVLSFFTALKFKR